MSELTVKIPIGDWEDEYLREEVELPSEDALVQAHVGRRLNVLKTARLAIVARERHEAPEDILPANKPLFNTGVAAAFMEAMRKREREVEINGQTKRIPIYIGAVAEPIETDGVETETPDQEPQTYTDSLSAEGAERAERYLLRVVPGHIYRSLKILAANGCNLSAAADSLKARIDEMVAELEGETEAILSV